MPRLVQAKALAATYIQRLDDIEYQGGPPAFRKILRDLGKDLEKGKITSRFSDFREKIEFELGIGIMAKDDPLVVETLRLLDARIRAEASQKSDKRITHAASVNGHALPLE